MSRIPLISNLESYRDRTAIVDPDGTYSFEALIKSSKAVASSLLLSKDHLNEERVAFLVPPSFGYVSTLLGIWQAGGIAVPLCVSHPDPELEYVIRDSAASIVIVQRDFSSRLENIAHRCGVSFTALSEVFSQEDAALPNVDISQRAMIVYTSGTTSRPKGVVTTHANIDAQIRTLVEAWEWREEDYILNPLPLHHVHGIVNILLCSLYSGAICEMMPKFDVDAIWDAFVERDYSLFMAVPTIYSRLIKSWEQASVENKKAMSKACRKMRVMVSGSAALPVSVLEKWHGISGHVLLERYGMTEIGMALSNPLHGERLPGYVGKPLPGVEVKLLGEDGQIADGQTSGEILVKGPGVFKEYRGKPEATREAFTEDGWFRTGDIAERDKNGNYRILGRNSVDIIKSGGYKISALEIEQVLLEKAEIAECTVVGVADDDLGERVSAALVLKEGIQLSAGDLKQYCKENLAPYKVPREFLFVSELPRNQMGKVIKPDVVKLFNPR